MDCIFCAIIAGKIPAHKVYEDDGVLAFLDIAPVNYGHVLVVPKRHYANMEEVPEAVLEEVIRAVKKVGRSLKENFGVAGYNVIENNDRLAGQVVPHLHFHVVPRREGDGLELWPQGKYGDGEAEETAQRIQIK